MFEAYKKYHLLALLVPGQRHKEVLVLPKYTSSVVNKYLKPLCTAYQGVVNAYYSNKRDELEVVIEYHY